MSGRAQSTIKLCWGVECGPKEEACLPTGSDRDLPPARYGQVLLFRITRTSRWTHEPWQGEASLQHKKKRKKPGFDGWSCFNRMACNNFKKCGTGNQTKTCFPLKPSRMVILLHWYCYIHIALRGSTSSYLNDPAGGDVTQWITHLR